MKKNKEVKCIYYCKETGKCKNANCPMGYCFMAKNLYCEYMKIK